MCRVKMLILWDVSKICSAAFLGLSQYDIMSCHFGKKILLFFTTIYPHLWPHKGYQLVLKDDKNVIAHSNEYI